MCIYSSLAFLGFFAVPLISFFSHAKAHRHEVASRRVGAKKKAQVRNYTRGLIIWNIRRLNLLKITNYPNPVKDLKIGNTKVIGARSSTVILTEVVVPAVISKSGPFDEDQR